MIIAMATRAHPDQQAEQAPNGPCSELLKPGPWRLMGRSGYLELGGQAYLQLGRPTEGQLGRL